MVERSENCAPVEGFEEIASGLQLEISQLSVESERLSLSSTTVRLMLRSARFRRDEIAVARYLETLTRLDGEVAEISSLLAELRAVEPIYRGAESYATLEPGKDDPEEERFDDKVESHDPVQIEPVVQIQPEDRLADQEDLVASFLRAIPEPVTRHPVASPVRRELDLSVTNVARARFKRDVALSRAETAGFALAEILTSIGLMKERHESEFNREGYVYGLGSGHNMSRENWLTLADVYARLTDALQAILDDAAIARQAPFRNVAAAIGGMFNRARVPAGSDLTYDADLEALLVASQSEATIGPFDELRERADRIRGAIDASRLAQAISGLRNDVRTNDVAASFVRALDSGVRPGEREFRALASEHLEELVESNDARILELVDEILTERQAEAEHEEFQPDDAGSDEDPVYVRKLESVRAWTRGKQMMVLGGATRGEAKDAIQREMELAEIEWPTSNPDTNLNSFFPHVDRAEIVAHLTGFSRKGYKQVAKYAQDRGKLVVKLGRGYNRRRLVEEFYRQIVEPRTIGAP